jgi:hypothetical protein
MESRFEVKIRTVTVVEYPVERDCTPVSWMLIPPVDALSNVTLLTLNESSFTTSEKCRVKIPTEASKSNDTRFGPIKSGITNTACVALLEGIVPILLPEVSLTNPVVPDKKVLEIFLPRSGRLVTSFKEVLVSVTFSDVENEFETASAIKETFTLPAAAS